MTVEKEAERPDLLAEAIIRCGKASQRLMKSGLNERAIIALLHDGTGVAKKTIKYIFNEMKEMEKKYTDDRPNNRTTKES